MASYQKFFPFVEKLDEGVFNFETDQLVVALTNSVPSQSNAVLADITQISYTNLSSRNITTVSSSQTGGVYKLVVNPLTLTASGAVATFRYVIIYDDTATGDPLICFFDYGSSLTMGNSGDTFLINFSSSNGLFTVT